MKRLIISGKNRLVGELKISGAKNSVLALLCASLLTSDTIELSNVPDLSDVRTMLSILKKLGVNINQHRNNVIQLSANHIIGTEVPYDLVKTMRASILVLGPLLTRFGEAKISLPGGCAIGQRPVDQHIVGMKALGANVKMDHGFISAQSNKLQGNVISTDMVTVTGTENFLMASVLADGFTVLNKAAKEPEVVDLAELLIKMGARIYGHGTDQITVEGVKHLHGASHSVIPDRIEAGTYLCAAVATCGEVLLRDVNPSILEEILRKLRLFGAEIKIGTNWIMCSMHKRPMSTSFETTEYPGVPTDIQAQFMALNSIAHGISIIKENIFENRYMHVPELRRLGANIFIDGRSATVHGVDKLLGAVVMATDLRASAGLVIAGLAAEGDTCIDRIYHLERGYEKLEEKLSNLGAKIRKESCV